MIYDLIQKYIESALAELNNAELIREKGKAGRMALLIIIVTAWFTSEILHFTTGSIPDLILVDIVTILFLAEYMAFSTIAGSRFDKPLVYLLTFPLNTALLYLFVTVTGGAKSVFILLPAIYLITVFVIDSLLPIMLTIATTLVGITLIYTFNLYITRVPLGLVILSNIMMTLIGGYIQYYLYRNKQMPLTTTPADPGRAPADTTTDARIAKMKETLTKKEYEIVYHILKGLSTEELAGKLFIEETTVKFHLKNIFKKLSITSKTDLLSLFILEETIAQVASSIENGEKSTDHTGNLP